MIRRALVKDARAAHAVLLAAADEIGLSPNFADEAHQKRIRDECANKHVWIDVRNGEVAGVAVMKVKEIFYLAVADRYRKQGVASGLIEHVIDNVQRKYGCGVVASTRDNNVSTINLLIKTGFSLHPILKSPYDGWKLYAFGQVDR